MSQNFQNLDAEESLLGSVLIDPAVLLDTTEILSADDFFADKHKKIFAEMLEMSRNGKNIDIITLSAELEKKKVFDAIGGATRLTELSACVPSASHWREYADTISRHSARRKIAKFSEKISTLVRGNSDPEHILSEISKFGTDGNFVSKNEILSADEIAFSQLEVLAEIQMGGKKIGIKSGINGIDEKISAFQNSNLIIAAARPSVGKSAFAISMAHEIAKSGNAVGFFSLEMSRDEIVNRILAQIGRVNSWQMGKMKMTDDDFSRIGLAVDQTPKNIFIDDTAGLDIDILRIRAHKMVRKYGVKIIFVDYLQLLSDPHFSKKGNRVQEISSISRKLKMIAKELKIPVIALSQLSREVEKRTYKKPMLSDLRESGAIEQDADIIFGLWREEKSTQLNCDIIKYRGGGLCDIELFFDLKFQKVS